MRNLDKKMHKNLLNNNIRPHQGQVVFDLLIKYEWDVLYPPCSPDMGPIEFFPKLKEPMR